MPQASPVPGYPASATMVRLAKTASSGTAYSPDLNPVEWVRAHVKHSLADLAVMALDRLEALVRNRLKRLRYRPETLHGFRHRPGPRHSNVTLRSRSQ